MCIQNNKEKRQGTVSKRLQNIAALLPSMGFVPGLLGDCGFPEIAIKIHPRLCHTAKPVELRNVRKEV